MNKEIFKEIKIGGITKENLLQKLNHAGIQFNIYANALFDHPQFIPPQKLDFVKLVIVKPSDVDLNNPFSFSELVKKAFSIGLIPCPLYLAAFLRLEYLEQPSGPYLTIASVLTDKIDNYPNGFYIRNIDGILLLRGYRADDFCNWPSENEFVFINSK